MIIKKGAVAAKAKETFVQTNWNESYFCYNRIMST